MTAEQGSRIDAISAEIFANLFRAIVDEMAWIVHRSAHTTFVKETQDFGTALVTPGGEQFAILDSTGVTALVGIPIAPFIGAFSDWQPGDIAITNDPYTTNGMVMHLSDLFVLKPVYVEGELVCFTWAFIHCSDIGGNVPGSIDGANREIFQEGLRIAPTKLYRRGEINRDVVDLISNNCRIPALNWGDLSALVASLDAGEARVKRLATRYGRSAIASAMAATLDRTEALTRSILRSIPRGSYAFTEYMEDDYVSEMPVRIQLRLTSRGDGTVELDFTGSDPQVNASINLPTGNQRHHPMLSVAVMNFVMTQAKGLYINAGIIRCIDLVLPAASVVNASFPAACGARVLTSMKIHEATLGALAQAVPGRVPAGGASQLAITSISTSQLGGGGRVVVANAVEGGSGGGVGLDGVSGADFPCAALRSVPVEILESEAPVIVHRFSLCPDSEGAGRYRGGFGIEYAFAVTQPNTVVVTRGKDRHRFSAWGAAGGHAGTTGYSAVHRPGLAPVDVGKEAVFRPQPGEIIVVGGGGGGGFGDPHGRDPRLVERDVRDGLVSVERARDLYGTVLTERGDVDLEQTERMRMRPAVTAAFDFGAGRTQWERDWGQAFAAIAEWSLAMSPTGRRDAQERAYLAAKRRLSPQCGRSEVTALLRQLEAEWRLKPAKGDGRPAPTRPAEGPRRLVGAR